MQYNKTCGVCGAKFVGFSSTAKYCSQKCRRTADRRLNRGVPVSDKENMVRCKVCGKEFLPGSKHIKYCSIECSNKQYNVIPMEVKKVVLYADDEPKPVRRKHPCDGCVWGCTGVCIMPSCRNQNHKRTV